MKKMMVMSVLASALTVPVLANAATTADLKLIGTITPAACAPNFTGGATIDYGSIPAGTLSATAQTMLPEKTTKLTVTCSAPVKFALAMTDDRSASVVSTLNTIATYTADMKFGLGTATTGEKIGAYSLQISNETPDSGATQRIVSEDAGKTWVVFGGGLGTTRLVGFANSASSTTPSAHTSMVMDIRVVAAVDKTANLPITNSISIDGMSTFEVRYL